MNGSVLRRSFLQFAAAQAVEVGCHLKLLQEELFGGRVIIAVGLQELGQSLVRTPLHRRGDRDRAPTGQPG